MTRRQPLITIGMPVYNGASHLKSTLDSLLCQTFEDFDLVISDNASTDDTEAICRAYAAADRRVRYERSPVNIGAARNYKRAFDLSASEYFKWANADDLVAPQFLERCLEALRQDPGVILAYPKTQLIDGKGARIADYQDNLSLEAPRASERFKEAMDRIRLCNVIYGVARSSVLRKTRLMGSFIQSDLVFVAELALHGRFHEVPEVLFSRRMHAASFSSQDDARQIQFYNPDSKSRVALFRWRNLWEYGGAIRHSPIAISEKIQLWAHLVRTGVLLRDALASELWILVKSLGDRSFSGA